MTGEAAELIEALTQERAVYQQLLMLSADKQPVLIKGDVPMLEDLTRKEQGMLESLRPIEQRREAEAEKLARCYGITEHPVRLRTLIEAAHLADRLKLQLVWRQLEQVLAELAAWNIKNRKLIDMQLRYANCFIDVLTGSTASGNTYNESGNMRPKQNGRVGLINQKA